MRAVLTTVILFAATSAWAEWAKLVETTNTVFYVDPASIGEQDKPTRLRSPR